MNSQITELCTGCRACELSCPKKCISMVPDNEGFMIAVIDTAICVNCGLCIELCPQNIHIPSATPIKTYAAQYRNDYELQKSASGGAFIAFANYILQQCGVVYGSAYLKDWLVGHIRVDSIKTLPKLQSSKYAQSDTLNTYQEAKTDLENNLLVLYSGTPCQIAGLKRFLKKDYSNLITIDLICHGVPSPLLFKKYIQYLSRKHQSDVLSYNFRDKDLGWGLSFKVKTTTMVARQNALLDPYYFHFLQGSTYRECCYVCKYCSLSRVSDITIGDYWGVKDNHPDIYSSKGVSAILINTTKGLEFFDRCKKLFKFRESQVEFVAEHNRNLYAPTPRPKVRDKIYRGINSDDIMKYFASDLKFKIPLRRKVISILPRRFQKFIIDAFR